MPSHLKDRNNIIAVILLFGFSITLQIFWTQNINGIDIRVSASDFLLVIGMSWFAWELFRKKLEWPSWIVPRMYVWVFSLILIMAGGLVVSWLTLGHWDQWALLNKFFGFLVLLSYLFLGGVIVSRIKLSLLPTFINLWVFVASVASLYSAYRVAYFLHYHRLGYYMDDGYVRAMGLFENPNAFGIFLACSIVLYCIWLKVGQNRYNFWSCVMLGVCVAGLMLSGSRSAYLGIAPVLLLLLYYRKIPLKFLSFATLLACAIYFMTITGFDKIYHSSVSGPEVVRTFEHQYMTEQRLNLEDFSIMDRMAINKSAYESWLENPLFGMGLGAFYASQRKEWKEKAATIHTTGLWLLVELGVIGTIPFAVFFCCCMFVLYKHSPLRDYGPIPADQALRFSAFCILLVILFASIGTEIFYQRYFWFIAGMGIVSIRPVISEEHN